MFVSEILTKRCRRCGAELPIEAFNRMGAGTQYWCRECFRAYFKARGDQHRRQSGAARAKRVAAAREFAGAYLAAHPCVDCGEQDTEVLDFDHVAGKVSLVSALVAWGAPSRRIEEEIARCEVRCANCHRRVTARRAGWSRVAGDVEDPRRRFSAPARRNLRLVHGLLAAGRCVDCGEPDMVVLEFDHVGEKRGQISTMVWNVSLATLEAELARCEIRCCNCHRRITAARRRSSGDRRSTVSVEPP
jgi:hypothetical protein